MLATQRTVNSRVIDDSHKMVHSLNHEYESSVSNVQDAAKEKVTIDEQARDVAVANAKKVVHAERKYCDEHRQETKAMVAAKLFHEQDMADVSQD